VISLRPVALALACLIGTGLIAGPARSDPVLPAAHSALFPTAASAGPSARFLVPRAVPRASRNASSSPMLAASCAAHGEYCDDASNHPCCAGMACIWDDAKYTSVCVRPGEW